MRGRTQTKTEDPVEPGGTALCHYPRFPLFTLTAACAANVQLGDGGHGMAATVTCPSADDVRAAIDTAASNHYHKESARLLGDTPVGDFDVALGAGGSAWCRLMKNEEVEWADGEELVSAIRCSTFGRRSTIVHNGGVTMPRFSVREGQVLDGLVAGCQDVVRPDVDGFVPFVSSKAARSLREESRVDGCDWLNMATEPCLQEVATELVNVTESTPIMACAACAPLLRTCALGRPTEEHRRTHFPFDPACEICRLARGTRGDKVVGSSTVLGLLDDDEIVMTFDLKTGFSTGHDGENMLGVSRLLSVVRVGSADSNAD